MKMKKKVCAALIALGLAFGSVGADISTADAECFKVDSEKYEITDYKEICGNELKKGVIEAKDVGSLTQSLTMLTWYPEKYKGKLVKKNTISLRLKTDGYYCDECMMVYAAFEEK